MSPSNVAKRFAIAAAIVAAAAIAMLPLSAYADKAEGSNVNESQPFTSSVSQIGESTAISIAIDSASTLVDNGIADTISVNAAMTYNDAITRSVSSEAALSTLASNEFQVDLQDYGPFSVTVAYLKNGQTVNSSTYSIGISASEYNLAPLSASFPVVLYSLSYWDISTSDTGNAIPSIVMLDRPSAYNWDSLPSGMHAMPFLTAEQNRTTSSWSAFADYVAALYQINPNAKFHLYVNDITCSLVHRMIYANKIPEGNYSITLLSDGTATYVFTNDAFNVSDPASKNQTLIDQWNSAKTAEYKTGTVSAGYSGYHDHWDSMYALLSIEPGTEWWMTRTNLFTSGDNNAFASTIATDPGVKKKNVATMLNGVSAKGEQTVQELKALYNFNDGYFTDAEAQGKKAMMLLGTYVYLEKDFEEYASLTETMFGDGYKYYYKGHPNTPTALWPEKQQQLDLLDIEDIDSSVAAELILFFNPSLNLSGYSSSTYNSTTTDAAGGLWGQTKAQALSPTSSIDYSIMDWFATPISNSQNSAYQSLCAPGESSYLVEFSDSILQTADYNFAVYSYTRNTLSYYKTTSEGTYKLVGTKTGDSTVKWEGSSPDTWVPYVNGKIIDNGWVLDNGSWYLMSNGKLQIGWALKDGEWYFFNTTGIMQRGWQQINGIWYLLNTNGTMKTGWSNLNDNWYWLDQSGAMQTNWALIDGSWYWFNNSGEMATGWNAINGTWYLFDDSGAMQTGWKFASSNWYYLADSGAMQTGWMLDSGVWYYLNASGAMARDWTKIGNDWYYFDGSGAMQTGWQLIDGSWYYLNSSGTMVASQWVGNYYLLSNGAMATNQWIGKYHVDENGKWDATDATHNTQQAA